ncbi:MAG: hypothetical protein Q8P41_01645 [Pseudomonadota bacterium]|nr:hypothetical protein [Pseudomonadota bacterium]
MLLLSLLAACDGGPGAPAPAAAEDAPTWHADIAPIVQEHCGSCHVAGGVAPFALDDYAAAAPMAASMAAAVEAGTMPPWGAETTAECAPRHGFKDDIRLSADEKERLRAWADADAPEGDPSAAAELPAPVELGLTDPTMEVAPALPYVTSGTTDEFRCFSLDPQLTADAWLTGLQVVPGNAEVVHHVLVFADPDGQGANLVGADGTYDCFGGSGLSGGGGALLGAWAPGAFPFEAPEGTGIALDAGSRLVMQIHYHPLGEVAEPDSTAVQLRLTETPPGREAVLALLGNASSSIEGLDRGVNDRGARAEFRIPADVPDHVESITYDFPRGSGTYQIFMAGTHMHYVGTDMLVQVDHAAPEGDEPATECLVQTPRWDFNWQRGYAYDAPLDEVPVLRGGDTLRLRCTYDNTLDNPGVRTALEDAGLSAPADVYLGESTLDEMCLGVFGIVL